MGRDRDVTFGKADADQNESDEDVVRIEADDLESREDLDLKAEVRDLRRTVNELKDIVHEQQQEIENLKNQNQDANTDHLPSVENFCRDEAYQGLSNYQERVTEIWRNLPKHATRNAEKGTPTYALDYSRLCDALADVDPDEWASGEKVDSSQARYAREAFEEIAPCRIDDTGGGKKVVVNIEVWATYRPDTVAKTLMKEKDVREFIEGGD